jgi:NADH dehydrogenase/NADH:ubiquinone oxidoreductase subunit G
VKIRINGIDCEAQPGEFILDVARRNNIYIPTLCHHDAFAGEARCRLCIVEVVERGRSRVVTSCVYPVAGEIEVATDTEKIRSLRKTLLMLLLARTPQNETIKKLAREYGVTEVARFESDPQEECILCNLCVRACEQLGAGAIYAVNRGVTKKVATLFEEPAEECIGCAACAAICPTGAIKVLEKEGKRIIWNREFEMVPCSNCGRPFATAEQLAFYRARLKVAPDRYGGDRLCENCRQKRAAELASLMSPARLR